MLTVVKLIPITITHVASKVRKPIVFVADTNFNIFYSPADITAEELFNMFFGGGFPQQNVYVRRGGGRWARQTEAQAQHTHGQVRVAYRLIKDFIFFLF